MELNRLFDHTTLGPNVGEEDIKKVAAEAIKYNFFSICIPPCWIKYAKNLLKDSNVKITTVIGFPHGNDTSKTKSFSTKEAIKNGADEIDMVINIGKLKDKDYQYVLKDIKAVRKAAKGKILKVIIETSELTEEEIKKACELSLDAKADFVKTSTGYTSEGATKENVQIMKNVVGDKASIKASGGIRTLEDAIMYYNLGVKRIGASKGVNIIEEYLKGGKK